MTAAQSSQQHTVEQISAQAYAAIAASFPVCAASDEFYFFPQVVSVNKDWRVWDDFSRPRVEVFADRLLGWEESVAVLDCPSGADSIDASMLQTTMHTLREQLIDIAPQCSQPTFHLTVIAVGLREALEADCSAAWADRIAGLPDFLRRAVDCLDAVPRLFIALGRAMAKDLCVWLHQLQSSGFVIGDVPAALELFIAALEEVPVSEEFILSDEQFERLLSEHLCCGLDADAIRRELEIELTEMDELLCSEAARLAPGRRWQELDEVIPFVVAPNGNLLNLYRPELERMEAHVRESGVVPSDLKIELSPDLAEVPESLAVIRASDAYGARPGYPARGGTFYVYSRGEKRDGVVGRTLEYRMTAAHEAWPGHHLLDICRWNLPSAIRRPIERPLCYEGWACLAEELMARSGYFDGDWDRFLLARRRSERAARGLVDLGLQTGRMDLTEAAQQLVQVGYPRQRAEAVVPKYALRPGYQVCYSLGLRQSLDLLQRYDRSAPATFARTLLRQGQVGFANLERVLSEGVG